MSDASIHQAVGAWVVLVWRAFCRSALLIGYLASWPAQGAPAEQLELRVELATGELALFNPGGNDVNFVAYSLDSSSGGLVASEWLSISDNYDQSGDRTIDADQDWSELIGVDDTRQLAEAVFSDGDGGTLSPGQLLNFGAVWDNDGALDLSASVVQFDNQFAEVSIEYVGSLADFNRDNVVDAVDFATWFVFRNAGTAMLPTQGDADRDGDVDLRDFAMWQQDAGSEFAGLSVSQLEMVAATAIEAIGTIPEPTTFGLGLLGMWATLMTRKRTRTRTRTRTGIRRGGV